MPRMSSTGVESLRFTPSEHFRNNSLFSPIQAVTVPSVLAGSAQAYVHTAMAAMNISVRMIRFTLVSSRFSLFRTLRPPFNQTIQAYKMMQNDCKKV